MTCTGWSISRPDSAPTATPTAIYPLPCLNPDATPTRTRSGDGGVPASTSGRSGTVIAYRNQAINPCLSASTARPELATESLAHRRQLAERDSVLPASPDLDITPRISSLAAAMT